MILVALFVLGLILGSFLNALAWRIHGGEDFVRGRSHCDKCGHKLSALDLIPLFSWLYLRGRCRYCHEKVSWQHPAVEVFTGLVFAASYQWWIDSFYSFGSKILFVAWLAACVGLIALAIYDLNWMKLPNKLVYPSLAVAAVGRLVYLVNVEPQPAHAALLWAGSVLVASGFFWLLFIISRGRWIGYGDVRLGLVTGTLLATPTRSFLMIFLASVAGTLISVPLLMIQKKSLSTRLPYGPFLILSTMIVMLFGQSIIDWYDRIFL